MLPKTTLSLTCAALAAVSLHAQDSAEKITYQDHIRPLLESSRKPQLLGNVFSAR